MCYRARAQADEDCFLSWHERIDQEVRLEVDHGACSGEPLSPCIRPRILPRRRTFRRQPHLILQLPEHLEGFGRCHCRGARIHPAADFHPLRRRQLRDGGFDFSERAHGRKMPGAAGGVNAIIRGRAVTDRHQVQICPPRFQSGALNRLS